MSPPSVPRPGEDGGPGSRSEWDEPGAMGLLSAWLYEDDATFAALLSEAMATDPPRVIGGLTSLAATAVLAYAQAQDLEPVEVLRLLGEITARRA